MQSVKKSSVVSVVIEEKQGGERSQIFHFIQLKQRIEGNQRFYFNGSE